MRLTPTHKMLLRTGWWLASLAAAGVAAAWMTVGGERGLVLTGPLSDAHHQIGMACESCHAAPVFAAAEDAEAALNKACLDCHDSELRAADDSHSVREFRNPRMAVYRERLDARLCTSCHVEHSPEITRKGAVTVAADFCVACHGEGEQDVRAARPSHAGLGFDTCADCHNYHDNRALYADFLVKNAHQPWLADDPVHALSARQRTLSVPPVAPLALSDAIAPATALADQAIARRWAGSGHALSSVNCAACHAPSAPPDATPEEVEQDWTVAPPFSVCRDCHRVQARTFAAGRHGMRQHPLISPPREPASGRIGAWLPAEIAGWFADDPHPQRMTAGEARIAMRPGAASEALDCGACHGSHAADTREAAVGACASCHNEAHTLAYFDSPHHALWEAELSGAAAPGSGVSCATCHMTRTERRGTIVVSHNQNDNLRPNEKMIRTVCLDCHGLGFSLDSLADPDLVARNFNGRPAVHVESIEWALRQASAGAPDAPR